MDDRDFFQGTETTLKNQIIYRNFSECNVDTDLDSNDKFNDIEIFEGDSQIWLEFVKFNSFFKNELICKDFIDRMVEYSIQATRRFFHEKYADGFILGKGLKIK